MGKGSYPAAGPVPRAGRADRRPQRPVAHRALDRVPRLRQPADQTGRWSRTLDEGARAPRHRPRWRSGCATSPAGGTRSSRSTRPADGDWEQTVRLAAERIGWGTPVPAGRGRGIAVGIKSGPDDRAVVLHRPAPRRRQRRRLRRHLRHGPGRPDGVRPDRRPGARRAARLGHGRHGRHRGRARTTSRRRRSRSTVLMGNCGPRRLPRHPGQAAGDGRALHGVDEADVVVDRGRRAPAGRPRADRRSTSSGPASAGWAASSSGLGEVAQGRRARPPARRARRRSSSSTARPSRPRSTRRPATSRSHRHVTVSRRGQGDQPAPGPDAGRGRGDHGPRPHADGALHLRRDRAHPEPGRDRLPDPDAHGPAARAAQRVGGERGRPGPVRLQGHERGRAAVRRPRGRPPRCARRDRRRHPRPAR